MAYQMLLNAELTEKRLTADNTAVRLSATANVAEVTLLLITSMSSDVVDEISLS